MKKLIVLIMCSLMALNILAADNPKEHTVERGETLASIAQAYNITVEALLEVNPMAKDMFYTGLVLIIPASVSTPNVTVVTPSSYSSNRFGDEDIVQQQTTSSPYTVYGSYSYGGGAGKAIDFGLGVQANAGMSTFSWSDGKINPAISLGGDIFMDMCFNDRASFIPKNWYMELDLGYLMKGASSFEMSYIQAQLYPLGYRIPLNSNGMVLKGGVEIGFPLNSFWDRYSADIQVGACFGVKFELGRWGIGCNISYDFTEVSSSCGESLNNFALLGCVSFKFAKF